ncbi:uncharacterized protein EKO05_0009052 [Ascochyta rabiei]|uniref:uncharacterized protein n=1 Tax=Didymella rabiei TaxID=5454 RepID=UPI00220A8271|nr:uncharacterized protein EKO05_0009052 [Ascochyta rabiei]UPX18761.1 hypothetical protein EKO05_0009052 [Ascochyta rabiei]
MRPMSPFPTSDILHVSQPCLSGTLPDRAVNSTKWRHVTSVTACQRLSYYSYSWGNFRRLFRRRLSMRLRTVCIAASASFASEDVPWKARRRIEPGFEGMNSTSRQRQTLVA